MSPFLQNNNNTGKVALAAVVLVFLILSLNIEMEFSDVLSIMKLECPKNTTAAMQGDDSSKLSPSTSVRLGTAKEGDQAPKTSVKGLMCSMPLNKEENSGAQKSPYDACGLFECSFPSKLFSGHSSRSSIITPSQIWQLFKDVIIGTSMELELEQSTHDPNDREKLSEWADWLWKLSSPSRMRRAINMQRQNQKPLRSIANILLAATNNSPDRNDTARPLRILVVGGSVPQGTKCTFSPFPFLPNQSAHELRTQCVYSARLQKIMDAVLGENRVQIHNMAMGGTSSDVGAMMAQFELWGDKPDVILADFAVNDFHKESLVAGNRAGIEQFTLAVASQRNCTTGLPMLVYLNEFFAWPESTVPRFLDMHSGLHQLAAYHDFTLIDYVNSFRDFVYADLSDTTFRGAWLPQANLHGGRSFHITMAWVLAYSFLDMAFDHCFFVEDSDENDDSIIISSSNGAHSTVAVPQGPRPALMTHTNLTFDELSAQWRQHPLNDCNNKSMSSSSMSKQECDFVWIANRIGDEKTAAQKPGDIEAFLASKGLEKGGWKEGGEYDRNKHGWVPVSDIPNATFALQWVTNSPIQSITIVSMLSYGDAWADSKIRMSIWHVLPTTEYLPLTQESFEWEGFHDSKTSVSAPFIFDLVKPIPAGGTIRAEFALIAGSTFKISGMMFCSSQPRPDN